MAFPRGLGRDADANLETDLGQQEFFARLPQGKAVLDKSFASVQTMNDEGFTFTYRLARVSFPKIREYGLKWDERSRTMYATQQTMRAGEPGNPRGDAGSYTLKGIQSRNPNAINGNLIRGAEVPGVGMPRGRANNGPIEGREIQLQNYIDNFKRAFAATYPTGLNNDPQFILAKSDFRSDMDTLSMSGETRGVETNLNIDWTDLMTALNDKDSDGVAAAGAGLGAGGLKNRFLELNKAAHEEVNRRYKADVLPTSVKGKTINTETGDGNYEEVLVPVRLRRFPKSSLNHSQAFNYGSLLSDFFESGDNESTRKLEQKLKVTSVELIKTLANNYEVANGQAVVDSNGTLIDDPDRTFRGVPKYKINVRGSNDGAETNPQSSGSKVRFWQPHDGELLTAIGRRRQWRMALLEYEPLMNHNTADVDFINRRANRNEVKNMITNHFSMLPSYNQTFMKSRLLNLRQYVLVVYLLDSNNVQQYYACAPEKLESLAVMVSKFHEAVKARKLAKPASQGGMEHMRISSFDPSSGFKKTFEDTWEQISKIRPLEYNPFSRDEFEDNYSPALYTDLWDTPVPLFATKDRTIKFDIDKGGKDMLEFLANLPGLSGVNGDTPNYMESLRGLYNPDQKANLLSVPQINDESQTTIRMRRSGIKTELSVRHPKVVISPVVNQAFRLLREQLGINKVSSLTPAQKQRLNRQMEEIFRPRGNLFLSYVFGLVLHNALTPRMLGVDLRTAIGYRNVAQVLLDTVPFVHSLGRYEAMAVFQHDVVEKLIGITQSLEHARAERTLQNVLYHALGNFEINGSRKGNLIFGLPVGEIVKNYNTLKRNAKVYEDQKWQKALKNVHSPEIQAVDIEGLRGLPVVGANEPDVALEGMETGPAKIKLVENFLYYKFVALDKTYQQNHVIGLKFDPFGPKLRDMDRETREFMFSEEDTKRRLRNRDEKFGMPSVLTTTSVPDVQTLDSRQSQALREVGKIGAPSVMLDSALTKAQQNRRLMGL